MKEVDTRQLITQKSLFSVALSVRLELEAGEVTPRRLAKRYREFFDKPDLEDFIEFLVAQFPRDGGTLAALLVKERLGGGGEVVRNGSYEADGEKHPHTFLLIEAKDGHVVVDIAADQFGGPAVHVGVLQPPWRLRG